MQWPRSCHVHVDPVCRPLRSAVQERLTCAYHYLVCRAESRKFKGRSDQRKKDLSDPMAGNAGCNRLRVLEIKINKEFASLDESRVRQ